MTTLLVWTFWIALGLVAYTYVGYGLLLAALVRARRLLRRFRGEAEAAELDPYEPEVTLLVAAYNEEDVILDKVRNSLALDYPRPKLRLLFVTDGSTDRTREVLHGLQGVDVMHEPGRSGKMAAMNRAMETVTTPIVIFSDANTMLNREAVREIVRWYRDPQVGAVAGEKRIKREEADAASSAGEGAYWRYESTLKRLDAELYSVVGAAGELFSVRTELYRTPEPDTLLDDFVISLRIAERGYRVAYAPNAYSTEWASATVGDEWKRKVRICAGGFQAIGRLRGVLNPARHRWLTLQYVSHRVLRWTLTPLMLLLLLPINAALAPVHPLYAGLLAGQLFFYSLAGAGWVLRRRKVRLRWLFVPFYFSVMHLAVVLGFARFVAGSQSVLWEKAVRAA